MEEKNIDSVPRKYRVVRCGGGGTLRTDDLINKKN